MSGGRTSEELVTQEPGTGGQECFSQSETQTNGEFILRKKKLAQLLFMINGIFLKL